MLYFLIKQNLSLKLIVIFMHFRRRKTKYQESLNLGFNNVLYVSTPPYADGSPEHTQTRLKESNLYAVGLYTDIPEDTVVENK